MKTRAVVLVVVMLLVPVLTAATSGASERVRAGSLSLLVEPNDGFGAVYSFISSAIKSIDVEMYELNDATAEKDLVADARRGVAVRVILDRAYSGESYNDPAFEFLSSRGVPVRWGPASTILHEKAIVVDDARALIATFNLANTSNYYATTRDFGVFDSNASDALAIGQVFKSDWGAAAISEPRAADSATDLVWSPGSESAIGEIIASARHSLLVENEEMSDAPIVADLERAARRGVDVQVVMTADSSWISSFNELSRAGVHVATYSSDATPYIHAKVIVADAGTTAEELFVGSENLSVASLDYDRELGLVTHESSLIATVAKIVRSDFAGARTWREG